MLNPEVFRAAFGAGLGYEAYVATGTEQQRATWAAAHASVALTDAQRLLIQGFTRHFRVLVSSGVWCGDCVQQCPMLDHIAVANPAVIGLRFIDRDRHPEVSEPLKICGGLRVPTVVFLNEDFEFVGVLGDRTLARYRFMASQQLGPSCPLPGAALPENVRAETLQDWVDEVERAHLVVRLSPKLRERHGD